MNKIKIDDSKCIGCSACVALYPDNFKLMDGKAVVIRWDAEGCEDVIGRCPMQAISIL